MRPNLLSIAKRPFNNGDSGYEWIDKMTEQEKRDWDSYCIDQIANHGKTIIQLHIDAEILYDIFKQELKHRTYLE